MTGIGDRPPPPPPPPPESPPPPPPPAPKDVFGGITKPADTTPAAGTEAAGTGDVAAAPSGNAAPAVTANESPAAPVATDQKGTQYYKVDDKIVAVAKDLTVSTMKEIPPGATTTNSAKTLTLAADTTPATAPAAATGATTAEGVTPVEGTAKIAAPIAEQNNAAVVDQAGGAGGSDPNADAPAGGNSGVGRNEGGPQPAQDTPNAATPNTPIGQDTVLRPAEDVKHTGEDSVLRPDVGKVAAPGQGVVEADAPAGAGGATAANPNADAPTGGNDGGRTAAVDAAPAATPDAPVGYETVLRPAEEAEVPGQNVLRPEPARDDSAPQSDADGTQWYSVEPGKWIGLTTDNQYVHAESKQSPADLNPKLVEDTVPNNSGKQADTTARPDAPMVNPGATSETLSRLEGRLFDPLANPHAKENLAIAIEHFGGPSYDPTRVSYEQLEQTWNDIKNVLGVPTSSEWHGDSISNDTSGRSRQTIYEKGDALVGLDPMVRTPIDIRATPEEARSAQRELDRTFGGRVAEVALGGLTQMALLRDTTARAPENPIGAGMVATEREGIARITDKPEARAVQYGSVFPSRPDGVGFAVISTPNGSIGARLTEGAYAFNTPVDADAVKEIAAAIEQRYPGAAVYIGSGGHGDTYGAFFADHPHLVDQGFLTEDRDSLKALHDIGVGKVLDLSDPADRQIFRDAERLAGQSGNDHIFTIRAWCFSSRSTL